MKFQAYPNGAKAPSVNSRLSTTGHGSSGMWLSTRGTKNPRSLRSISADLYRGTELRLVMASGVSIMQGDRGDRFVPGVKMHQRANQRESTEASPSWCYDGEEGGRHPRHPGPESCTIPLKMIIAVGP